MTDQLQSLTDVLVVADDKLRFGLSAGATVWPSGLPALDEQLSGGFRSGELVLLAGPQGLGKTTLALQVLRNVVSAGRSAVYFSFEHDPQVVLERLLALELPEPREFGDPRVTLKEVRAAFGADGSSGRSLVERLTDTKGGIEAIEAVRSYSDRLHVHRSSGSATTLANIRDVVAEVHASTGQGPLVVVDYLQKVRAPGVALEEERITAIAEGLKDLALELELPVVSVAASDKEGLEPGKRMRMRNLGGSSALAYEADIVLILNEKFDVVARHHLMYDLGNAHRYREWVVLTIEKNRSGKDRVDLEFRKRFAQGRFDVDGKVVEEQLVDERVFVD